MERTKFNICKAPGIYKIQSTINNKIYIGSSINLKMRKRDHFTPLKNNRHYNKYLQRHANKYGIDDLQFSILEFCRKEKLIEREQYYIDTLNPRFNLCPNANNSLGYKHSNKSKELISKVCTGRKHTDKTKKIIAATSKERWENSKYKEWVSKKIAIKLKGNTNPKGTIPSDETRRKLSIALVGNTNGTFGKGRKHSDDTKRKMSIAKIGITLSEEHKQNISKGHKKHDKKH